MKNLNKFNEMFQGRTDVNFPFPFEENTIEAVLVETFVEGVPVTYY
jgi:predicted unusual protein kinase regulating ubiquinone biosynthesis (AarF/ABC1/UbiB family)